MGHPGAWTSVTKDPGLSLRCAVTMCSSNSNTCASPIECRFCAVGPGSGPSASLTKFPGDTNAALQILLGGTRIKHWR